MCSAISNCIEHYLTLVCYLYQLSLAGAKKTGQAPISADPITKRPI